MVALLRRSDASRLPADGSAHPREVARAINSLIDGRAENRGTVTLASGTTETTINSPIFGINTVIVLVPTTSAGAAIAWWQEPSVQRGTVLLGHDAPGTDVEFRWVAVG